MKLFLALPVYGGYNAHFVTSLLQLVAERPCEMVIRPCIGDSLVARARNRLCAEFLASDCTHLLFIDTDLIFSVDHIRRLISHAERGHDIVAGLYPKKQRELGWVCNILEDTVEPDAHDLVPVKYAGTGCLMFTRHVLTTMTVVFPEIAYDPDEGDSPGVKWDFFATGVRTFSDPGQSDCVALSDLKPPRRRYLSEDWMFCQRALDCGFRIMMDTRVVMKHVGEFIYPLQDLEVDLPAIDTAA